MSPTDRVDVLRARYKDLLVQLRQHREKLEQLGGCSFSLKREREDEAKQPKSSQNTLALRDGKRGRARSALAKSTVTPAVYKAQETRADTCERQTGVPGTISTPIFISHHTGMTAKHAPPLNNSAHCDRHDPVRKPQDKSCQVNLGEKMEKQRRVTFQSDEREEIPRHPLQPLLGYDWIAGILDVEDSVIERSDEFFNDLQAFRALNKKDCVHSPQAEFFEEDRSVLPTWVEKDSPEANMDTHQCIFSYRINNRLFPVPVCSQERCSVCKKHKSSHPHTADEPAHIRVSIPQSTLLPPYKYKAHRRCSFDLSNSLGLQSHCLSSWSNTCQSCLRPSSNLDLRSSLNTKSSTGAQSQEPEDLTLSTVPRNHQSYQIPDVPRLAHYNFQHFSPKRKLGSTSRHMLTKPQSLC